MKIHCLLVEDEPAARKLLESYIADVPELTLIASCKNALEAGEVLRKSAVQLLFLDINMPKLSGLAFYKSLSHPPYVIFTTAYPQYAVEGFELDAVDYLLKPFPFERFLKAVNKAIAKFHKSPAIKTDPGFLILKSEKKLFRIGLDEMVYLEAFGDYVKVHCVDKVLIVHETFQTLINQLPENEFIRIHKSFAISLHKLNHIEGNTVHIKNVQIPIGQAYKADFLDRIKA
ncbi:LytTR family DNA-binding domain-containing protein [Echinicola sediminis]